MFYCAALAQTVIFFLGRFCSFATFFQMIDSTCLQGYQTMLLYSSPLWYFSVTLLHICLECLFLCFCERFDLDQIQMYSSYNPSSHLGLGRCLLPLPKPFWWFLNVFICCFFPALTSPKLCPCCCTQQTSAIQPKVGTSTTAGPPPYWRSSSDRWVGVPAGHILCHNHKWLIQEDVRVGYM